jgi:hypothetical protein
LGLSAAGAMALTAAVFTPAGEAGVQLHWATMQQSNAGALWRLNFFRLSLAGDLVPCHMSASACILQAGHTVHIAGAACGMRFTHTAQVCCR